MEINTNVFRSYDIRGVYDKDINETLAYKIGLAFGTKMRGEKKSLTLVGYDNRFSSVSLYNALVKGLTETGLNVVSLGLVTTPMYYFALDHFKMTSGIMITASHNPKDDNGFKMTFNGIYNAYGKYIEEFRDLVLSDNFIKGEGIIINKNIKNDYIKHVTKDIKLGVNIPKIVLDCGNGTASIIAKDVFEYLKIPYTGIYMESDPSFPNHHPDPSVEKNLEGLKNKVLETSSLVGFSYDGDADRVGIVNEKGQMINIDLFMIIILRDIMNEIKNKNILFDVKCSKALEDEIIKLGGTPICYRTGNSYLRAKLVEDNLSFAGELSGHIFFNDRFNGFDDGIYASLRLIEIMSKNVKTITELLEGVNNYISTREEKFVVKDDEKFDIVSKVLDYSKNKGYKVLDIDGCKVIFEDGFALIRASNTGPNLTTRFEATTEIRLNEIKNEFENKIKEFIS